MEKRIGLLLGIILLFALLPSISAVCVTEGMSCGYQEGGIPLCCAGLDCQYFQCVETDSCSPNGVEKCGSTGEGGIDIPGEVLYKCIDGTWKSQGKIDQKCGYEDCGVTGDSCNEFSGGCCDPYYTCENGNCVQGSAKCESCFSWLGKSIGMEYCEDDVVWESDSFLGNLFNIEIKQNIWCPFFLISMASIVLIVGSIVFVIIWVGVKASKKGRKKK